MTDRGFRIFRVVAIGGGGIVMVLSALRRQGIPMAFGEAIANWKIAVPVTLALFGVAGVWQIVVGEPRMDRVTAPNAPSTKQALWRLALMLVTTAAVVSAGIALRVRSTVTSAVLIGWMAALSLVIWRRPRAR